MRASFGLVLKKKILELSSFSVETLSVVKEVKVMLDFESESLKRGRSFINCGSLSVMMVNCFHP